MTYLKPRRAESQPWNYMFQKRPTGGSDLSILHWNQVLLFWEFQQTSKRVFCTLYPQFFEFPFEWCEYCPQVVTIDNDG